MARKRSTNHTVTRTAVSRKLLEQVLDERGSVRDDIGFLLSSAGVDAPFGSLSFDNGGLRLVEESYWRLVEVSNEEIVEIYERKMAIFLGECLIESYGGEWIAYSGNEIVFSPVVVKIDVTGLHHDVFLLCSDLRRKPHVLGQKQYRALRNFLKAASRAGFV